MYIIKILMEFYLQGFIHSKVLDPWKKFQHYFDNPNLENPNLCSFFQQAHSILLFWTYRHFKISWLKICKILNGLLFYYNLFFTRRGKFGCHWFKPFDKSMEQNSVFINSCVAEKWIIVAKFVIIRMQVSQLKISIKFLI